MSRDELEREKEIEQVFTKIDYDRSGRIDVNEM